MVSEDLPKESASAILRRCLVSSMDAGSVHAETFAYGLQFQPSSAPNYFEQICRPEDRGMALNSLIDREARKESLHGNGHGLSLTLGSELPAHANAVNSSYSSNGNIVCDGEINSRVYNALNPPSQNFNSMATILTALQRSPYMKPAQQLLDEVVCVSNAVESGSDEHLRRSVEVSMADGRSPRHEGSRYSSEEKDAVHVRISKLVALLDQLETRYEQYFHQMDTVVSAFEAVAGVGAAASYTALTIQAMSKHFSNLRDAIINQLNAQKDSLSKDTSRNYGCASSRQKREALHHLGMIQIGRVWRPLRGLPEESVAHLRSWLFEHFLHPYPTDNEKLMLASQTGLTRNQISNWFINARVRLWKPMIEEMYREEFAEDMQD